MKSYIKIMVTLNVLTLACIAIAINADFLGRDLQGIIGAIGIVLEAVTLVLRASTLIR